MWCCQTTSSKLLPNHISTHTNKTHLLIFQDLCIQPIIHQPKDVSRLSMTLKFFCKFFATRRISATFTRKASSVSTWMRFSLPRPNKLMASALQNSHGRGQAVWLIYNTHPKKWPELKSYHRIFTFYQSIIFLYLYLHEPPGSFTHKTGRLLHGIVRQDRCQHYGAAGARETTLLGVREGAMARHPKCLAPVDGQKSMACSKG